MPEHDHSAAASHLATGLAQAHAEGGAPWLYLASQSPRRRQLLDQLGVRHALLLPGDDEDAEALEAERPGESPEDYVQRVTQAKWRASIERLQARAFRDPEAWPMGPILCADTTVALGSTILGKPADAADAERMLRALSGQTHRVLTAVCVHGRLSMSTSHVQWRPLEDAEITRYVASGEPFGKAGAYAIQGRSGAWTRHIDGSYSGIMGLPLFDTAELLKTLGWAF